MTTLREVNYAGPCLTLGTLVRETEKFWFYSRGARTERVKKDGIRGRYLIHLKPCPRCMDHPQTEYPRGFDL